MKRNQILYCVYLITIWLSLFIIPVTAQTFSPIGGGLQTPGDGVFYVNGHTFVSTCNPMYLYKVEDTTFTELVHTINVGRINQIVYDYMHDEYILIGQFNELINMLSDTVQSNGIASFDRTTHAITAMGTGINSNTEYFYDGSLSPTSNEVILQGRFAAQTQSDTAYNALKINLQSHAYSSFNTTLFNKNMDVPRRLATYNNNLYGTGSYMLNGQICLLAMLDSTGYHPVAGNFQGLVMDAVEIPAGIILVGLNVKSSPFQTRTDVVLFDGTNFSLYCQVYGTVFAVEALQNNLYFGGDIDSLFYGTQSIAVNNFCGIINGIASDCAGGVTSLSQTATVINLAVDPIANCIYLTGVFDNVGNNIAKFTPTVVSTVIESVQAVNDFKIYPNPAHGSVNIESSSEDDVAQIVSDDGRVVGEKQLRNGNNVIDIISLKKGMYWIRKTKNGGKATTLVVN